MDLAADLAKKTFGELPLICQSFFTAKVFFRMVHF